MITLTFGVRLNAESWAKALADLQRKLPGADFTANGLRGESIDLDLRGTGYTDFVTLGHLLIFVRAAGKAGAACRVLLPSSAGLAGPVPADSDAAMRAIRRHNCRLYLEQTGVVDALGDYGVTTEDTVDTITWFESDEEAWPSSPLRPDPPHRARRILRYRWLPRDSVRPEVLPRLALDLERAWRELGLSADTSATVTRGILLELLENAERHSEAQDILLGGMIVDHGTFGVRVGDFEPALRRFAQDAADQRRPLLRLVVGDTGRGLGGLGRDAPEPLTVAAILQALDSRPVGESRGTARGLWKVSRVVRAHKGALLVTSGGRPAGRVHTDDGPQDVSAQATIALPGTIVECALLTDPSRNLLAGAGELMTPQRRAAAGQPKPQCVVASLDAPDGLPDDDLRQISAALECEADEVEAGFVVAVNVSHTDLIHDAEIGQAIVELVELVAAAGGVAPTTLAFPNVNRVLMSVAVEYLNADAEEPATSPMLVLGPDNRHYWIGGTSVQRRALGRMSSAAEPASATARLAWPADEAAAVAELVTPGPVLMDGDTAALRMLPQDAKAALARWVGAGIERAITDEPGRADEADVWHGVFRTPTLRVTDRWFDLDALLTRLELVALTGVSLATLVEPLLGPRGLDFDVRIVRLGHASPELLNAFARWLTGEDFHDKAPVRPGRDGDARPVLLVADVVSSGATVAAGLLDVLDEHQGLVVVAAVADTRPDQERLAEPGTFTLGGRAVPLVSLTSLSVDISTDQQPKPIDPVLRRPESGTRPVPVHLVEQKKYVDAMRRNSAARLGHIERPADRHYTAYVDPTLLFRETNWATEVLPKITEKVLERQPRSDRPEDVPICLLYPQGTTDDITTAADLVQRALTAAGLSLPVGPVAVPRAAHAANRQLPGSLDLPAARHAVILDSGASSGRTVQQLIGLAADTDIETITVILLINGMSDSDAVNLQRITTARHSGRAAGPGRSEVEILYVARTAMSYVPSGRCGICALRHRYASATLYAPVPEALHSHRDWLLEMLRPRPKQALFQEQAADLFGANVSQRECVAYLAWRLLLRAAELDTDSRWEVKRQLDRAEGNLEIRNALVRLLVAEPQWLTSAPLSFPEFRPKVAALAGSMLTGAGALLIEQRLRVQAATLLARVAPNTFAAGLIRILEVNRKQGLVICHVLLETLLLILGPPGPVPHGRRRVAEALERNLDDLRDRLRDPAGAAEVASDFVTLPHVRYLLSHVRQSLREPPGDAQDAWSALQRELRRSGHDHSDPAWSVRSALELYAAGYPLDDIDDIAESWETCARFLHDAVLPYAQALRPILMSGAVVADPRVEWTTQWQDVLSAGGSRIVDETTVGLGDLINAVGRAETAKDEARALLVELQWWFRFLFDPQEAMLPRIIRTAPIDVVDLVERRFHGRPNVRIDLSRLGGRKPLAFCVTRLFRDAVSHALFNATETHRRKDKPMLDQQFLVEVDVPHPGRIAVTIRNDGSASSGLGEGKGLETLRHRLAWFNGEIRTVTAERPWTYAILIALEGWRG